MPAPRTRVTDTGAVRVTQSGATRVTEGSFGTPDPRYDLQGALESLLPGVVVQRELLEAAAAQYQTNGFTPLTAPQALASLAVANTLDRWTLPSRVPQTTPATYPTALPAFPTQLPRFIDSNPDPFDGWAEFGGGA